MAVRQRAAELADSPHRRDVGIGAARGASDGACQPLVPAAEATNVSHRLAKSGRTGTLSDADLH